MAIWQFDVLFTIQNRLCLECPVFLKKVSNFYRKNEKNAQQNGQKRPSYSMPLSTKIKLFFVVFAALALWQGSFRGPEIFLFLGVLSLLLFLFAKFFSSRYSFLFLWLPLLLFLFFVRLILIPQPIVPPEAWYGSPNSSHSLKKVRGKKIYARGNITSVIRPGVYLAELEMLKPKRRGAKQRSLDSSLKKQKRKPPLLIPVYLQVNDYYLLSACRVWLTLRGKGLPQRLPQSSFGNYIKRKGALSILRLSRKDIYRKDCRRLDLRGKFQNLLGRILYKSGFSLHQRGVAMGLLLGRSGYMQFELKKKAVELGILHLFAASGLHMGIFYLCFYWPLSRWRGKKSKLALALPLFPCFAYMFFLGFPVSLLRAFTFLSFHALQSFIYRKVSTHDLLLNSALALLFLQPHNFLSLGTFLSFGAVSGILYFYSILWREMSRIKLRLCRPLLQQLTISVCAGLFTLPILLYAFGAYSYSSLVANVLLVPFIGILMPLLIGALFLAILSGGAFLFLMKIARQLTEYFIALTEWLSNFSFYISYESIFSLPFWVNLFLIFSLTILRHYAKEEKKSGRGLLFCRAGCLFCILLLSPFSGILEKYRKAGAERKEHSALEKERGKP